VVEKGVEVVERQLGRQRREREVVDVCSGAVFASSAIGMLVIGNIHDGLRMDELLISA
jgi:hypothetical protein